ncbi:hypothetical protein LINPERPRIM_LOCUS19381 [Linum perenne]
MNRGEDFIGMLIADLLLPLDFWSDKEKRSMVGGFWCSETDMFSDLGKKSSTDLQPCRELSVHSWRSLRTCSVIQSGKLDVIIFRKIKISQNLQETGYKFAYDDCHREK